MAAVNRPTDIKVKEKDINNKLQLYGIFTAFSNGKVPSNKQIDVALNSALAHSSLAKPSPKLSSEGRKIIGDLQDVIKEAKYLLLSKNEGNLLQDFIWQTQNLSGGKAKLPGAPTDKATAQQHGNEALDGLRTLGTLIISNGQFRKLLNDATILIRDMVGDAAQNAANKVNPSEDQLNQIDAAAEDNTWHDVPDISKGNVKSQLRSQYDKNKPFDRNQAQNAAENAMDASQQNRGPDGEPDAEAGAREGVDRLKGQADENVPEETKQQARETKEQATKFADRSKGYLSNKMPEERRDQTVLRLKKMLVEIQGHSDYQQAIETLLDLAKTYGGHANAMSQAGVGTVKGAHTDDSLQVAETDLKTLIERFANSTSTDDLFESFNNIYKDADRDPELKNWFKSIDAFIRKCLKEQGFILKDSSNEEWNSLHDKGQFLLRDRYRDHTNRIMDEFKFLADQFEQDPANKRFGNAVQKLFQDLGQDEDGKPAFKKHLVTDVTSVIIPSIFEHTRYVPVPRVEISDPMIDAVIENLVIESDNLAPSVLEFGSDNYFRWGRKGVAGKRENKIMVSASGIQMDLKDVSYYVKKKQGFPSITDKGVMDIFLGGQAFSFKLAASTAQGKDRTNFVKVDSVKVDVKNLKIKIKQSNHKLLFGLAKGLVLKVMRPVIEKAIQKVIKDKFEEADALAYSVYQEVEKAKKTAKEDPEKAVSLYQNYVTALQKKITAKKQKAEETVSNTKVNMAITQHDSIFKDIKLPGGISTKATEFRDLAYKGDKWESPVFGIGSAKESTDIPKLTPIKRKPHNAASGSVRGSDIPSGERGGIMPGSATGGGMPDANINGDYRGSGNQTSSTNRPGASNGFTNQVNQAFDLKQNNMPNKPGQTGTTAYYDGVTTH